MEIRKLTATLGAAFQSNKMFLVASDPKAIAPYLSSADSQVFMGLDPSEQWQFNLDPQQWSTHGTIVLPTGEAGLRIRGPGPGGPGQPFSICR